MKIDLVYLWVDGSDRKWFEKRGSFLPSQTQQDLESFSQARFTDSNELLYSLRSVERYAPWINHIYIVTDEQTPAWLNTQHPKITVVDNKDILPPSVLPTFNSVAIELGIVNIKGLSEYFLYANDDMMFCRSVSPSDFITPEGLMRCRFKHAQLTQQERHSTYGRQVSSVCERISTDFTTNLHNTQPHHNIDIYSKSVIREVCERYPDWVEESISNRFRSDRDMQRHIFSLYALVTGRAAEVHVRKNIYLKALKGIFCPSAGVDSMVINLPISLFDRVKQRLYNPAMICINDNQFATPSDRLAARQLLEKLYPNRSSFER